MPAPGPKINLVCQWCGQSFIVTPFYTNKKYCSKTCSDKGKAGKPNILLSKPKTVKICEYCGKNFHAFPFMKDRARFCSMSCAAKSRVGKSAANWHGGKVKKLCLMCDKPFYVDRHQINRLKCCSKECQAEWQSIYRSGELSPSWQGGLSFAPYPPTFNKTFKRMIRELDNHTCQMCGKNGNHVHHIDYCKSNTTPDNCITLCRSCHPKTNWNREYWQEYFSSRKYRA